MLNTPTFESKHSLLHLVTGCTNYLLLIKFNIFCQQIFNQLILQILQCSFLTPSQFQSYIVCVAPCANCATRQSTEQTIKTIEKQTAFLELNRVPALSPGMMSFCPGAATTNKTINHLDNYPYHAKGDNDAQRNLCAN